LNFDCHSAEVAKDFDSAVAGFRVFFASTVRSIRWRMDEMSQAEKVARFAELHARGFAS
jgi:hypothetical protein